jgi:hypothetical protein
MPWCRNTWTLYSLETGRNENPEKSRSSGIEVKVAKSEHDSLWRFWIFWASHSKKEPPHHWLCLLPVDLRGLFIPCFAFFTHIVLARTVHEFFDHLDALDTTSLLVFYACIVESLSTTILVDMADRYG